MKKYCFKTLAGTMTFIAILATGFVSCDKKSDSNSLKGIEFDEEEIELAVGDEYDLSEILSAIPAKAELPKCTYASDDNTVATVGKSTGKVKTVAEGETAVTVTTSDGKHSAECIVIVTSGGQQGTGYTVSGSLEYSETASWTNVSASFDDGESYAATASISNSRFSLALPAPSADYLGALSEYIPEGVTVNPKNAMGTFASFFARKGTQSVEISHVGLSGENIFSLILYVYADGNVSVTGVVNHSDGKDDYNLQLKKGWNTVINTWDYSSSENDFYKTGAVPSGAVWISESDISSSPPSRATYRASGKSAGYAFTKAGRKIRNRQLK